MSFTKLVFALACLMCGTLAAQEAKVTQLLSKDLTNLPGKEGLRITVEYPPGLFATRNLMTTFTVVSELLIERPQGRKSQFQKHLVNFRRRQAHSIVEPPIQNQHEGGSYVS